MKRLYKPTIILAFALLSVVTLPGIVTAEEELERITLQENTSIEFDQKKRVTVVGVGVYSFKEMSGVGNRDFELRWDDEKMDLEVEDGDILKRKE